MSYPFRRQAQDNEEKWTPPDYATPVSEDKWEPPEYATPVEDKKNKPGLLSRAIEAIKPAKKIHATGSLLPSFLKSVPEHTGADTLENPTKEPGTFWGGFAKSIKDQIIPQSMEEVKSAFSAQNPLFESAAHPKTAMDFMSLLIPSEVPHGARGEVPGLSEVPKEVSKEPSVRQPSSEINYRMGGTAQAPEQNFRKLKGDLSPEQIDKLKKDEYEFAGDSIRQPEAQHRDFGYPEDKINKPKVEDTGVKQLQSQIPEPPKPKEPKAIVETEKPKRTFVNPFEKPKIEAAPIAEDTRDLPIRSPNLSREFSPDIEPPKPKTGGMNDEQLYNMARERFNMGKELPTEEAKTPELVSGGAPGIKEDLDIFGKPKSRDLTDQEVEEIKGKMSQRLLDSYGEDTEGGQKALDEINGIIDHPLQKDSIIHDIKRENDLGNTILPPGNRDINNMIKQGWKIKSRLSDGSLVMEPRKQIESPKPTATFAFDWPEAGGKKYNIKGGPNDGSTVGEDKLKELGIDVPTDETPKVKPDWKPPAYASEVKRGEVKLGDQEQSIIDTKNATNTPESFHPQLTGLKNYGDGVLYLDFDKTKPMTEDAVKDILSKQGKDVDVTEMYKGGNLPNSTFRVDIKGADEVHSDQLGNDIEKSVGGAFDSETEMHGGLGGIKPSSRQLDPNKGPYGAALDKLFNSMGSMQENRLKQDIINKTERAKRFAAFSSVKDDGAIGAAKSLSALKGEFEKVDFDRLQMTKPQVDSLFTAIKRANITPGEKARGYTALFKIMNGTELPQRNELKILDDVFGNNFADKITQMHGGIGAVGLKVSKLANTMKSMQNSISLAAPLRHGIGLIARKEFYPAFADMFKFFANPEFFKTSMQALEERPNYMLGREGGLFLAKPGSLLNSEEEFLNSYVGSIPGVRNVVGASQRAYVGFLNKLRADTFDSMIKQARDLGFESHTQVGDQIIPTKETKAIANYINNATGRGDLGSLNKMTNELNLLLWSPRMISSRITMLTNPTIYTSLPKGMRLDGLKSLFSIAALGTAIDTLAAYGGAKVSTNILSTDFGKSRFGKKLIDPWGGFQQYIVGAARFLAGKTDSNAPTSRLDIAGRFLANKESPAASLAHSILTAKKMTGGGNYTDEYGDKTSIQSEIAKRFTPIFVQDIEDLMKSQPDWSEDVGLNTAMGAASLAGMSQQYPEKKKGLTFRKLR